MYCTQPLPSTQVHPLLTHEPRNAYTTAHVYNDVTSPTGRQQLHRPPSFGARWNNSNFAQVSRQGRAMCCVLCDNGGEGVNERPGCSSSNG